MDSLVTFAVEGKGDFTGRTDGSVAQFKNVPFGHIGARFQPATLAEPVGSRMCTDQGPLCPQNTPYRDSYLGIKEEDVREFELLYDEFNCLNLMISMPAKVTKPLPVVVWLHGGGDTAGTAYRGINDPLEWVRRGVQTGKPFIVVTLQFRVGLLAFLPLYGVSNLLHLDQKLGIEWVHTYISSFGGDPERITVFGQSAGGQCAQIQASVDKPLFKQAACFSGDLRGRMARSLDDYRKLMQRTAEYIGVEVDQLAHVPWQDIVRAQTHFAIVIMHPCDDGHMLPFGAYHTAPKHMERVMILDCINDGYFFMDGLPEGALVDSFKALGVSHQITDTYQLRTNEDVCRLLTDYIFLAGDEQADEELQKNKTKVFRMFFDAINPIAPEQGNMHMVELLYAFRAYKILGHAEELSRKVQDSWIKFVCFEDPWNPDDEVAHVTTDLEIKKRADLGTVRPIHNYDLLRDNMPKNLWNLSTGW